MLFTNYIVKFIYKIFLFPGDIAFIVLTNLHFQGGPIFDDDDERNFFHPEHNPNGEHSFIIIKTILSFVVWLGLWLLITWKPPMVDAINLKEKNGLTYSKNNYDENVRFTGIAVNHYSNGEVSEHISYHAGRKHGISKTFSSNGELIYEQCYKVGKVEILSKCKKF